MKPPWTAEVAVSPDLARSLVECQLHLGDVALDLSVAHTFLPPSAHDAFRRAYGPIEEPTWRLARFRALHYGIFLSDYGHATGDRDIEREGLLALEHVRQS